MKSSVESKKGANNIQRYSIKNQNILNIDSILLALNWPLMSTISGTESPISSADNQKGINAVQRCSVENQKGAFALQILAIAPF